MAEKLNPMTITDPEDGREYTLEYSRKTAAKTEQAGLSIDELDTKPMTMIPLLFWGAFLMHHPYASRDLTDRILFDGMGGLKPEEMAHLGKLYAAPFQTLIATEGKENPRKMSVTF